MERFRNDAKSIVDTLFNTKIFVEAISRDNMNEIENLIQFMLESRFESQIKAEKLLEIIKANAL